PRPRLWTRAPCGFSESFVTLLASRPHSFVFRLNFEELSFHSDHDLFGRHFLSRAYVRSSARLRCSSSTIQLLTVLAISRRACCPVPSLGPVSRFVCSRS